MINKANVFNLKKQCILDFFQNSNIPGIMSAGTRNEIHDTTTNNPDGK